MTTTMTSKPRGQRGLSAVEAVVATALLAAVLGAAIRLLDASEDLATSSNNERAAALRVERTLSRVGEEFRRGSVSSALHLDGTAFADGDTGAGFTVRPVIGWEGDAQLGGVLEYRLEREPGAVEGDLVRVDGPIQTTLATGITAFSVSRDDRVFTFTVTAHSGPDDDRGRTATGSLAVMARNP